MSTLNIQAAETEKDEKESCSEVCNQGFSAVLYTLLDMARFPWATVYLPALLGEPEIGAGMSLLQGLGFVPFVTALYSISNVQSLAYGQGDSGRDRAITQATIRRAADQYAKKLALYSMIIFLSFGSLNLTNLPPKEDQLVRQFCFSYAWGTLPALWVINRQESLISLKQGWSLAGLNALSFALMGGISYSLVRPLNGFGLGFGFGIPSVCSLLLFELFLKFHPKHQNSFWNKVEMDQTKIQQALIEVETKSRHSFLSFLGSYVGFFSTFFVQFFKDAVEENNIANGILNQTYYLIFVPGTQISQALTVHLGHKFGKLKKTEVNAFALAESSDLDLVKTRKMFRGIIFKNALSLSVWVAAVAILVHALRGKIFNLLLSEVSQASVHEDSLRIFESTFPWPIAAAGLENLKNLFFASKRTLTVGQEEKDLQSQKYDSTVLNVMGVLSLGISLGLIFLKGMENLSELWMPLFFCNYLAPFAYSLFSLEKHLRSMEAKSFLPEVNRAFVGVLRSLDQGEERDGFTALPSPPDPSLGDNSSPSSEGVVVPPVAFFDQRGQRNRPTPGLSPFELGK